MKIVEEAIEEVVYKRNKDRLKEREREQIGVDGGGSEVYIKKRSNV